MNEAKLGESSNEDRWSHSSGAHTDARFAIPYERKVEAMRQRRFLGTFAVVTAAMLFLGACAGTPAPSKNAGKITIAVQEDIRSADNLLMRGTTTDRLMLGSTVYEPLFTTDVKGKSAPALALKAQASTDLLTWTITLREGVKFSNGKAFTSADVIANLKAMADPKNASGYSADLKNVKSTEASGDYKVVFTLKTPDATWDNALQDTIYFADLSARAAALLAPKEIPVGTGPYTWSSRDVGSSIKFTPNAGYWRGTPGLKEVTFRAIPEAQAAVIDLQQGVVDMIANYIPQQSIPTLKADPNIKIASVSGSTFYGAFLNFEKDRKGGYADGESFRLGLAHLMNTEKTIPALIGAFGVMATQPIPAWMDGFNPDLKHIPYDEAEGIRLLAKGGIKIGGPIKLLALRDRPLMCEWATVVQSNLKKLGYDAQLTCLDSSAMTPELTAYKWDLLFWRTSGRANAAVMYQQRWGIDLAINPKDTYTLQDKGLQTMIDELRASGDPAKYTSLAQKVATRIVTTDAAVIPGYFDTVYFAYNARVKGFNLSPTTWYGILDNAIGRVTTN
jgi:peptide/nickel transport system substrate-binding protein